MMSWAIESFHHFLYGNIIQLHTDQKPLESNLAESLTEAAPRFYCILTRTLPYSFDVKYVKGIINQLVNQLSQLRPIDYHNRLPITQVQLQATASMLELPWQPTVQDDELVLSDMLCKSKAKHHSSNCK